MDEDAPRIEIGPLISGFFELFGRHAAIVLGTAGALAAVGVGLELISTDRSTQSITNLAGFFATFMVLRHILRAEDLILEEGRLRSYFGASLLSVLGTLLGLVLLVVPGLFVMARWSLAGSLVLTRNLSAREAMGASWRATRNCGWILVVVYLGAFAAVAVAAFVLGGIGGALFGEESIVTNSIIEVIGDFVTVTSAVLSVAIYRQVVDALGSVRTIFA